MPVRPSVTCVVVVVVVSGQEANRKRVAKRSRGLYGRNCRRVAYAFVRVFLTRYRLPRIATVETVVVFFSCSVYARTKNKPIYVRPCERKSAARPFAECDRSSHAQTRVRRANVLIERRSSVGRTRLRTLAIIVTYRQHVVFRRTWATTPFVRNPRKRLSTKRRRVLTKPQSFRWEAAKCSIGP